MADFPIPEGAITRAKMPLVNPKTIQKELAALANTTLKDHDLEIGEIVQQGTKVTVFEGRKISTNQDVIVKVSPRWFIGNKKKGDLIPQCDLVMEMVGHKRMQDVFRPTGERITSEYLGDFTTNRFCFAVQERIPGQNLHHYFSTFEGDRFAEVEKLLEQILEILSLIHAKKYIHRDISTGNFIITPEGVVYIVDFEMMRSSIINLGNQYTGTTNYMSVGAMREEDMVEFQDLESVVYVLSHFYEGNLPWIGLDQETQREEIIEMKEKFIPQHPRLIEMLKSLRY